MKRSIPVIAALAFMSGCQTLQDLENPLTTAYSGFDEDGDGVISKQEAQESAGLAENFNRIDTNRSGGIDGNEYAAATTNIGDLSFDEVDINGDGVVSQREAASMPVSLNEAFDTIDADSDGNVSPVEYQAARTNLLQSSDFGSLDTDGDGVIGAKEAGELPTLSESYDRVDTDADGLISEEEYGAAQR